MNAINNEQTALATLENEANKIKKMFADSMEHLFIACKYYAKSITDNPLIKQACIDCGIPASFLKKAEDVGRGVIHYQLLLKSGSNYRKLEQCAYSDQDKYLKEPIPVLCVNGDVLNVSIDNLTKEQSSQVFGYDHIRDLSKQKAYIESVKTTQYVEVKPQSKPYAIKKNGLLVGTVFITKAELLSILTEM